MNNKTFYSYKVSTRDFIRNLCKLTLDIHNSINVCDRNKYIYFLGKNANTL